MFRIVICDDEPAVLEKLRRIVSDSMAQMGIPVQIHTSTDLSGIGQRILASCDLALLDIDLAQGDYNGMDIARKIRALRQDAVIIFITNYIEYAPEGYEVQAFRYVMKFEAEEKLPACLDLAVRQLNRRRQTLKIKANGEVMDLRVQDILYIESQLRQVVIHVQSGQSCRQYQCYAALADLEKQLSEKGFLRIHKSFLVNGRRLKRLHHDGALLDDGTELPVSARKYPRIKNAYLLMRG